jgi:hypothetical protein
MRGNSLVVTTDLRHVVVDIADERSADECSFDDERIGQKLVTLYGKNTATDAKAVTEVSRYIFRPIPSYYSVGWCSLSESVLGNIFTRVLRPPHWLPLGPVLGNSPGQRGRTGKYLRVRVSPPQCK